MGAIYAAECSDPGYVRITCPDCCVTVFFIDEENAAKPVKERDRYTRRCTVCSYRIGKIRQAAAHRAHQTRLANGTNFASAEWHAKYYGGRLPAWLARESMSAAEITCQRVIVKDGVVHDIRRVPVVLVDRNTLRVQQWVTLDVLKKIWPGFARERDAAQRTLGFTDWTIAPQDCTETGELPSLEIT